MRTFTEYCGPDSVAYNLVNELLNSTSDVSLYREKMVGLGQCLANSILPTLNSQKASTDICVVCTVEDADFLARGLIEQLERKGFSNRVHIICLWNDKIRNENVSLSPIIREYKEPFNTDDSIFVVVKSIISGACVVKTNLTRAISIAKPTRIIVAAPVMLEKAEERLSDEFPIEINSKFEFVHFATDSDKDGENVQPGIGGSLYELLGLGNVDEKNRYVPGIVKQRRQKIYGSSGSLMEVCV